MCTAATYQSAGFYFGRTLDYEVSYGNQIVITPRNYALRFRHTVLHVDCRHIGVRTLFEVNGNGHRTRITGGRSHVSHVFHTVYSLFQRSDNTLLKSFGARTVVGGTHHDGRRRNIRILLHRERKQTDDTQNDNRDGCLLYTSPSPRDCS